MSQSSRFVRFGFVVATGLIAVIGLVPSGAVAGSAHTTQVGQSVATSTAGSAGPLLKGEGWCC